MSVSMSDVIAWQLLKINESRDSTIAAMWATISTTSPTFTPDQGVTRLFNDAKDVACRSYFPVDGLFTATYANGVWTQDYAAYAPLSTSDPNLPVPTGSLPWWAFAAQWTPSGGVAADLKFIGNQVLKVNYPQAQNPAAVDANNVTTSKGVPSYFYRLGTQGVGLYLIPAASGVATIQAWRIPEDVTPTGSFTWATGNEWQIVGLDAILKVVNKASNDGQMLQRVQGLIAERNELVMNKYMSIPAYLRVPRNDGVTVPFGTPPMPMVPAGRG